MLRTTVRTLDVSKGEVAEASDSSDSSRVFANLGMDDDDKIRASLCDVCCVLSAKNMFFQPGDLQKKLSKY